MRLALVISGFAALVAGGVYLFFFDPATGGWYPVCTLYATTGLLCPGCGTLRGLHQLVHGNFAAAWGFNPLVMTLLPFGLWLGLREVIYLTTGKRPPGLVTRPFFGWVVLAAVVVFGVARNLPAFHQ